MWSLAQTWSQSPPTCPELMCCHHRNRMSLNACHLPGYHHQLWWYVHSIQKHVSCSMPHPVPQQRIPPHPESQRHRRIPFHFITVRIRRLTRRYCRHLHCWALEGKRIQQTLIWVRHLWQPSKMHSFI
mgnify:CR=1 FL=1